jgi:hypothetical protein
MQTVQLFWRCYMRTERSGEANRVILATFIVNGLTCFLLEVTGTMKPERIPQFTLLSVVKLKQANLQRTGIESLHSVRERRAPEESDIQPDV